MTRLAIFDLDGTLLNTIGDLAVSCNAVLALRGLPQHSYEDYCRFVGNGIMRLVERALPEALRTPYTVDAVRRDFVAYYLAHIDEHTLPYEGIPELLDELQRRGVRLAVASNKFQAGTEKLIGRYFPDIRFDVVPSAVFTNPECGMVGLTEEECKARGMEIETGKSFFRANGKSLALGETEGLCKLIFEKETGLLVGAHIMGPESALLAQQCCDFITARRTRRDIEQTIFGHPTLSEVILAACR